MSELCEQEKKARNRYIKIIKLTYTDVAKDTIEDKINGVSSIITQNGGKVVSFMEEVIGVGLSTVYWIFCIVYEAGNEIPPDKFSAFAAENSNE